MSSQTERIENEDHAEILSALAASNGCQSWIFIQVDLSGGGTGRVLTCEGSAAQDPAMARAMLERIVEASAW